MGEDKLTLAEYQALPDDGRCIDELSRGHLVREPRPGDQHGEIVSELFFLLRSYTNHWPVGRVTVEGGFLLGSNPPTVRGPDIAFVRSARLGTEKNASFFIGAPDLAIEVVSPSNRPGELLAKISEFLDAGTQIVWVVYPATRTVVEHAADGSIRIFNAEDTLSAPALLPGFEAPVEQIFA